MPIKNLSSAGRRFVLVGYSASDICVWPVLVLTVNRQAGVAMASIQLFRWGIGLGWRIADRRRSDPCPGKG